MKSGVWLPLCLGVAITCPALPAQANRTDRAKTAGAAHVTVVPSLRGDLTVTIYTYGFSSAGLDAIRRAALPCDWRPEQNEEGYLRGVCRKYLPSDGASASGSLALAPLVAALHEAGAGQVRVDLDDFGNPLASPPPGWTATTHGPKTPFGTLKSVRYRFASLADDQLPQPVEIRLGTSWSPSSLAVPFAFVLFAPALLAAWLRRRAERKGATQAASVWVHWILTGTWLYWISSVSISGITALAAYLQLDSMMLTLAVGTAAFAVPPLLATASCIAILLSGPAEAGEPNGAFDLVKKSVAREATLIVPFGIFLVGTEMFQQDWHVSIASWPVAYFTYRILGWSVGRWLSGRIEVLSRGDLVEIAGVVARRAGVALGGVYIIARRSAREANAFASGSKVLALTSGLVEHLTRREVVAVIGHEVGHLRGKHVATRLAAFWGYVLVVGPLAVRFVEQAHLPHWLLSLPLLPIGYILVTAFVSRNHEFSADARAVELTRDPEGMIAALARLCKMTCSPVDWGGIQGSILSHPSMRDRVLAIARRFNVAEDRALALLNDPDLLAAGTPPEELHFRLPAECSGPALLFTSTVKAGWAMWGRWIGYLILAGITLGVGEFALKVWPRPPHVRLALLVGLPLIARLYLASGTLRGRYLLARLRSRLSRRMGAAVEGGTFVGLLPGDSVTPVEGFYLWDAGFLLLSPDYLTYRGERSTFSVPRTAVTKIAIGRGPLSWDRAHAVVISCEGGSFSLSRPDKGASRRQARLLGRRLTAWWRGEPLANPPAVTPGPLPERALLASRPAYISGLRAVRMHVTHAFFLWIGLVILLPIQWIRWTPAIAFVPFMAPLAYLVATGPTFFRPKPPAQRAVQAPPAVAAPQPAESAPAVEAPPALDARPSPPPVEEPASKAP